MPGEVGSIRYSLREPFDRAVQSVCQALVNRGLRIAGHLDVSRRVERSLGIVLPPCRIVFVMPRLSVLSSAGMDPSAAAFLPLHIVVSGNGALSEIQVQNRIHRGPEQHPPVLAAPILETQAQMREAIEAIAMRPSLVG